MGPAHAADKQRVLPKLLFSCWFEISVTRKD